jgi:hypothetical protein
VVTTPVGCRAVFGIDPGPLRGRVVDLGTAWLAAPALRAQFLAEGDDAGGADPGSMLDRTEAVLRSGLDETDRGLQRCPAAVAALESEPARWPGPGSPRTCADRTRRTCRTRRTWSVTSHGTPASPTAYVGAQRQFLDPGDDPAPGFVREG